MPNTSSQGNQPGGVPFSVGSVSRAPADGVTTPDAGDLQPGFLVPDSLPWSIGGGVIPLAARTTLARFVPPKWLRVSNAKFAVGGGAGIGDQIVIGIYEVTNPALLTLVATTGLQTGLLQLTGVSVAAFNAPITLRPYLIYYAATLFPSFAAAGPTLPSAVISSGNSGIQLSQIYGSVLPLPLQAQINAGQVDLTPTIAIGALAFGAAFPTPIAFTP